MKDKPPFEPEHNSICAYADMPILEFYKGYFECVYIMLHPFIKIDEQGNPMQTLTWREIIELTRFESISQLDIALRNYICGLVDKWKNEADVQTLDSICGTHNLRIPFEGKFPDTFNHEMLASLQEQGHDYMFIADEHGFERKIIYIQDLIENKDRVELTYPGNENWYTNKHEILYTTHWDSHFTLLCSDKATIENILSRHPFEGFYCDNNTEIYWSLRENVR